MQGVECVDNVLFGSQELTLEFPNVVNPRKNKELNYSTEPIMPSLVGAASKLQIN